MYWAFSYLHEIIMYVVVLEETKMCRDGVGLSVTLCFGVGIFLFLSFS